jgi:hypothetical protein
MNYAEMQYCPVCHQEGCEGGKMMKSMHRWTEFEQRSQYCEYKKVMNLTNMPDLTSNIKQLLRRNTNPRLGSKRIFGDRVKLFNSYKPQISLPEMATPIPVKSGEDGEPKAPHLSKEQVLAYARAFDVVPKTGLPSRKLVELERLVAEAIEKSSRETEGVFEDITVFAVSLAIQCDKAGEHPVEPAQLSHLLEAGYPIKDDDILKLLGEKCKYHDCKGKYVWRKLPGPQPKPPPVQR